MTRWGHRSWMRLVFLLALALTAFFALVSLAHAETPAAGEDVIVPLKKGAVAPFTGQLFDNKTAVRWGLWLKSYRELEAAEIAKARGICEADLLFKDDLLRIEQDKRVTLTADLKQRLLTSDAERVKLKDQLDHPPWYTSVWFGIGVGVVSTTTLVLVGSQVF